MGKNTLYKNCDTLGVLQNLEEKFDLIYLDAPYFSGSWEIGLNSEIKSVRHLIAEEKGCRLADVTLDEVASRKQILEQKSVDEFANFIVQLLISCKNRLTENGILCFLIPGQQYCEINYKLLLEQIFPSFKEVTLERRRVPHAVGRTNNDTLVFMSPRVDYEFPVLMELPALELFKNKDEYDYYRLDRAMIMQDRPARQYEFQGIKPKENQSWLYSLDKMQELLAGNRIVVKNNAVFVKRYRSECKRSVSDVWKDEGDLQLTGNTSIGSSTINKILDMCIPGGGRVFIPYERDGKFIYICNNCGIEWTSIYTPIVEGRKDYLQEIAIDSYTLITDVGYEPCIQDDKRIVTSTRAVKEIQSQNIELSEENVMLQDTNSGLQQENDELLELNIELLDENTGLRKENDELKARVENLIDSIRRIQLSVGMDENDEVTIDTIIERIHKQTMDVFGDMNFEEYIPKAKEWVAPHWQLLESESQQFIPTGLMLGELLDKIGDGGQADKAPVVIEYCKTLEKELFQKIFFEYARYLKDNDVDVKVAFRDSYLKVDGKKNKQSKVFAYFLKDATTYNRDEPEKWHFEIGKMARVLMMTLEGTESDVLFKEFREFLEKIFDEEFFKQEFEKSLDEIADLRNKCAHPNVVDEDNATTGKAAIREKLINILKYYK